MENLHGSGADPVPNIPVYLFKPSSSYLGKSATTDPNGQVTFSLPEKPYKVRVDYLGYQFWSEEISVATDASVSLSMPHGDVTVTVRGGTTAAIFSHGRTSPSTSWCQGTPTLGRVKKQIEESQTERLPA